MSETRRPVVQGLSFLSRTRGRKPSFRVFSREVSLEGPDMDADALGNSREVETWV